MTWQESVHTKACIGGCPPPRQFGLALAGSVLIAWGSSLQAADTGPTQDPIEQLQPVVVTGSLIPRLRVETATPLTVITAEDIQLRGFSSVADALKQSSFAVGSVQGEQFDFGFTAAAQTLSMFGLSPAYVKYLIDGRPMANYPALYGGTDVISTLSGIPTTLVDHIDILPGGQSSLYGSDAIAGVVNVVLKKKLDGPMLDARYGFFQDGGGVSKRITLANSFQLGETTLLAGFQYEMKSPIWGYQRELTASTYQAGSTPAAPNPTYSLYGYGIGAAPGYHFVDPNNCARVAGQFGGSVHRATAPEGGDLCGTYRSGYYTLANELNSIQGYLHATSDISAALNLYADALVNHDVQNFSNGAYFWPKRFYDPTIGDLMYLEHDFSPEEAGSLDRKKTSVTDNAYRLGLGLSGRWASIGWDYDLNVSRTQEHLTKRTFALRRAALNEFFGNILGQNLGPDPFFDFYPTYRPDYSQWFTPLTPAQYDSLAGYSHSHSQTWDNLVRMQFTHRALFALPGGPAAAALVLEGGNQEWEFVPDEDLKNGAYVFYTAVNGGGRRSRYAATTEWRFPVLKSLTLDASARYDLYRVAGATVDKGTYNLGIEYRPLRSVLIRGRYGTAFKAPTLPDEFQGRTIYGGGGTDYYLCAVGGFTGQTLGNCPYYSVNFSTHTEGNPALKSITAKVWNVGIVWQPLAGLSLTADYLNWDIRNEISPQSTDQILQTEALCRLGTYDSTSPTCLATLSQITRDPTGQVQEIYIPKINISRESLAALTVGGEYHADFGRLGSLEIQMSWSEMLKHNYQQFPTDPVGDKLRDPLLSQDFKSKVNASVTWSRANWSGTAYIARYGKSPNYIAWAYGLNEPGAGNLAPWTIVNLTAQYRPARALSLSVTLNNAFNRQPPADHSFPGTSTFPYNDYNYNIYGRSYFASMSYQWGR